MVLIPCIDVRLSGELKSILNSLKQNDARAKWIRDMTAVLRENGLVGQQIKKSQIPRKYRTYGVHNLYRYSHPKGYRSCYTLVHEGKGLIAIIFDIMSHTEYERVFGY